MVVVKEVREPEKHETCKLGGNEILDPQSKNHFFIDTVLSGNVLIV